MSLYVLIFRYTIYAADFWSSFLTRQRAFSYSCAITQTHLEGSYLKEWVGKLTDAAMLDSTLSHSAGEGDISIIKDKSQLPQVQKNLANILLSFEKNGFP